jgi:hypothetical protein
MVQHGIMGQVHEICSYFIAYVYDSYKVYNTVRNISNVRLLDLFPHPTTPLLPPHHTTLRISTLRIYPNIYAIWVSTTFRVYFEGNEPSFMWEVHLGMVCSSGAYTHGICLLVFLILIHRYIFRSIASPRYKTFGRHMYSRKTQWAYAIWWGWL